MTCHYVDLGSASDWLKREGISFLVSRDFICFLRLRSPLSTHLIAVAVAKQQFSNCEQSVIEKKNNNKKNSKVNSSVAFNLHRGILHMNFLTE